MNIDNIVLRFAKYKISKFDLIIPGYDEPFSVDPAHLGNFTIEKDFVNYVFPYMEFRVIVPNNIYAAITQSGENVYVDLKVEYSLFEETEEMNPSEALYGVGTIMDARFYAYITNRSPKLTDATTGEKASAKANEGDDTQYSYDNQKPLILMLYRSDHMFNTDQIINQVLSKATVTDALAYYFKQLNLTGVLMSPANNSKVYDQLILPPIKAISGLRRLAGVHGIHTAGTTIFFDYDMIYILDKKLGCTAWIANEFKTTYLASFPNRGEASIARSGFYANGEEKYSLINIIGNQISISNEAMFADQFVGTNTVRIDSNTGKVIRTDASIKVADAAASKLGKVNSIVMQGSGSDTSAMAKAEIEQIQKTLSIVVQDINIRALSPNKDFIFTTDNDKYKDACGHYRIVRTGSVFTKESTMYTAMTTATFVGGAQST